jgi:phage FluMu protein gp41
MSRPTKGNEDRRSAETLRSSRSRLIAEVIEPNPEAARALRKIARLFPTGFCVSVRQSASVGKIEVLFSDRQWKSFQEDDPPAMRLTVEKQDDGQFKLKRRSTVKQRPQGNGQVPPKLKTNGQAKPSTTRAQARPQRKDVRAPKRSKTDRAENRRREARR